MKEIIRAKDWMKDLPRDTSKTPEMSEDAKVTLEALHQAAKIARGEIPPPPGWKPR